MVVAEGLDDKTKYLISTTEPQIRVARLTSSGDGATAEHLFDIKSDDQILSVRTAYVSVVVDHSYFRIIVFLVLSLPKLHQQPQLMDDFLSVLVCMVVDSDGKKDV